ncbi:hypothetical protein CPHO_00980 [Corynebacterium phocae]|uniref:HNH nuclease domain-containing protein n=1 Tax=Corynebacterium phocae TaxID=161895 RepID=A0A1L7D0Q3_9CORY|nr:HNH endonuclease signature motif containing protein [Corynebacterium phocae]APT91729.1 hypothetical protein CPHO_00980 [Corynebacterium phocae]KAA8728495.1 HNH endonuclease [Corynebacterium phocae]
MNPLQQLAQSFRQPGLELFAACAGKSQGQIKAMGIPAKNAGEIFRAAQAFNTPTRSRDRQRQAIQSARDNGLTWVELVEIDKYARKLKDEAKAWRLRLKLCRVSGGLAAIRKAAQGLLKTLKPKPKPEPEVKMEQPQDGLWKLSVRADSSMLAAIATKLAKAKDKVAAFAEILEQGAPQPTLYTHVVITAEDIQAIEADQGEDVLLRMTDGAVITGAELARRKLAEMGFVTIVSNFGGPVNTYRLQRSASGKQRLAASVVNTTCVVDTCNKPAEQCEMHHMQAWSEGGETNLSNLVPLCPFHNGRNDDNPHRPNHGRVERVKGKARWVPAWSQGVVF